MKKLLLSLGLIGIAFAQQDTLTSHVAEELYKTGVDTIRSNTAFLKGFVYLRASCALKHKQACEELEALIKTVNTELKKLKVLPDRSEIGEWSNNQG